MAEINARSVLAEALEEHRKLLEIASEKYTGLVAKKGMEGPFEEERKKCQVLEGLIIGLQSEGVRREMAKWQKELMETGMPPERMIF